MADQGQHGKGFLSDESNKEIMVKPLSQDEEGKGMHEEVSSGRSKKIYGGEENGRNCHEPNVEREKRNKMRNMYSTLHHMIPELPSKVDQVTIVNEAVKYIKSLEKTVEMLEKQKQERLKSIHPLLKCESSMSDETSFIGNNNHGSSNNLVSAMSPNNPSNSTSTLIPQFPPVAFQTWSSPNVVLNICGSKAQFCIYTTKNIPDLLTNIAFVLEKHNIEVLFANIWSNDNGKCCMILAQATIGSSDQIQEATLLEQIYKEATEEIKLLIF